MSTAIHDLPDDVLLEIFTMNADLRPGEDWPDDFFSSPLTTTRRTSQVCRLWRHILLSSPSIWGRIIDMDFLDQKDDSWREEVLRRCRDARLHIRLRNGHHQKGLNAQTFFFRILKTEWARIRVLDVRDRYWDPDVWRTFHSANPTIEFFRIVEAMVYHKSWDPPNLEEQLFAGYAPSLRYVSSSLGSLRLDASWRSHIRHVTLDYRYDIRELLSALEHMERLESLEMGSFLDNPYQPTSVPVISMPRLRDFKGKTISSFQLLDFVFPARGCRLTINEADICSDYTLNLVIRVFKRFLQDHVALLHPLEASLLDFSGRPARIEFGHLQDAPAIRLAVRSDKPFEQYFEDRFFESLTETDIAPHLTSLQLGEPSNTIRFRYTVYIPFFQTLSSLHELRVSTAKALGMLVEYRHTQPVPFPALKTIYIYNSPIRGSPLKRFFSWRIHCGLPITLLDLTNIQEWSEKTEPSRTKKHSDFKPLEDFQGMEIRWSGPSSVESYVCGSGFIEGVKPWENV